MSPKWGTKKLIFLMFFGPPGPYGAKWGPEGGKRCSRVPKKQDFGAWMRSNIPSGVHFNMAKMQACHLLDWGGNPTVGKPTQAEKNRQGHFGEVQNR